MTPLDFASCLRACRDGEAKFTPESLAERFGVGARHFVQPETDGPILFHPASDLSIDSALLRGTIFWPAASGARQIVRGHPRIFSSSDTASDRLELLQEPLLARAAQADTDGGEVFAEPKLIGAGVRVYVRGADLYCASDVSHDGGNPMVGVGIDNSRALGIDYGSQAARILSQRYGRVERLARLGYTALFVLQLPEFAPDQSIDRADLVLVDVIDPDFVFVDRLEKERIAEDYGLGVVDLSARITISTDDPLPLLRRCRALEHQGAPPGSSGYVVKGRLDDGDQMFLKVEPATERDRVRAISAGDLAAVTEEIDSQIGDSAWIDPQFAEELILEYLGTHHRTARWTVNAYLASWQAARSAVSQATLPRRPRSTRHSPPDDESPG